MRALRPDPPMLEVVRLRHVYGTGRAAREAIAEIGLSVSPGELVSIVGPSGCGKTTLLRCIAGLMVPTEGSVSLLGAPVSGVPRGLAVVFQDYSRSLFPWMSVQRNVTFPLRGKGIARDEQERRARESIEAVGLGDVADQYPWQLSGGMQQRAALARALAYQPNMLLMDEPFASVDAQTRADLEDLLLDVRDRFGITVLFVTHDIDESVYVGDRVVVLSPTPARVVRELQVELPGPRDQIETRECDEFVHLRTEVARLVRARSDDRRQHADTDDQRNAATP